MKKVKYIRHTTTPMMWEEHNGEMKERDMLNMENVDEKQIAADVINKFLDTIPFPSSIANVYDFIEEYGSGT